MALTALNVLTQQQIAQLAQQQYQQQPAQQNLAQNSALLNAMMGMGSTSSTSTSSTTLSGNTIWLSLPTATTTTTTSTVANLPASVYGYNVADDTWRTEVNLNDGVERTLKMADGTVIHVEKDGTFKIDDKNAKTIYKGCPTRAFNPFLNASDKLEEFIKFCGDAGVRQGDMLGVPIELFVKWLVIEAARADGENTEPLTDLRLLPDYSQPRCSCGRFLSREFKKQGLNFCRTKCYEKKMLAIECTPV